MRALGTTFVYLALGAGAGLFLLPLLWMLSTALKPLEQTTVSPPQWLPWRYYAGEGSARHEVKLAARVTTPSIWAVPAGASGPVALPQADVHDGVWQLGRRTVPVRVLASVPASPTQPWQEVVGVTSGAHELVPLAAVDQIGRAYV